jgi:hypothetical protein
MVREEKKKRRQCYLHLVVQAQKHTHNLPVFRLWQNKNIMSLMFTSFSRAHATSIVWFLEAENGRAHQIHYYWVLVPEKDILNWEKVEEEVEEMYTPRLTHCARCKHEEYSLEFWEQDLTLTNVDFSSTYYVFWDHFRSRERTHGFRFILLLDLNAKIYMY